MCPVFAYLRSIKFRKPLKSTPDHILQLNRCLLRNPTRKQVLLLLNILLYNMSNSSSNANSSPSIQISRDDEYSWLYFAYDVAKLGVTVGMTYYITTSLVTVLKKALDPDQQSGSINALNAKKVLAKRLKRPEVETMDFNAYELRLMGEVIGADEINVSFDDIGGLGHELDEVKDNVVLPIQIYNNMKEYGDLVPPCPTGILLYGLPGTGKTLIAKAIAKEAGATFICVKASALLDKWFGESDRLVSALFSLGRKLSPSIIFIDEIETVLKKRNAMSSHESSSSMQGVFLAEWDGLTVDPKKAAQLASTGSNQVPTSAEELKPHGPVVVLGATNRPNDLDAAFLRRMPVKIQTRMPDVQGRLEILQAQLKDEDWSGVEGVALDLHHIAMQTAGYSGSDLRELVRIAQLQRAKEMTALVRSQMSSKSSKTVDNKENKQEEVVVAKSAKIIKRALLDTDFEIALLKAKSTGNLSTYLIELWLIVCVCH